MLIVDVLAEKEDDDECQVSIALWHNASFLGLSTFAEVFDHLNYVYVQRVKQINFPIIE